ncbi:hypothetical protein AOC36_02810 [Erysipelothrix larvae]|uniref:TNase-like domain-containing protein n=1 Tax=Erysipelothrix larvae TaxID=1514105 RepID=A0A0X8GYW1_9FIRM|nr:thermonuclease family protein [Erysipelothrix larvae]AMC92952.1 hypothetical protein AOC36_02810 [Erysipelothrix larvae]
MKQKQIKLTKRKINKIKKTITSILALIATVYVLYQQLNPQETAQPAQHQTSTVRCVDGDTFWYGDEKIRLLAIDTPESTNQIEVFGKEASERTCDLLNGGSNLEFYYDEGNEIDKYDRHLYWVYIDGVFLQELLVSEGLAEVKYVDKSTVDQSRLKQLENAQTHAKEKAQGIWSLDS